MWPISSELFNSLGYKLVPTSQYLIKIDFLEVDLKNL